MSGYPTIVHTEEGMRDGLQIESPDIPLEAKIRLLDALSETGLKEIAVGSFVSPKWTPQMACMVGHPLYGFVSKAGPRPHFDRLYRMDMPRIETLSQARHFILGPKAYRGAASPWRVRLTSHQRPDSLTGEVPAVEEAPSSSAPVRAVTV